MCSRSPRTCSPSKCERERGVRAGRPQNASSLRSGARGIPHSAPQRVAHIPSLSTRLPPVFREGCHATAFTGSSLSQKIEESLANSIMSLWWSMWLQFAYATTWNVAWAISEERNCGQPLSSSPLPGAGGGAERGVWAVGIYTYQTTPREWVPASSLLSKVLSNDLLHDYSAYHPQTFHTFLKSHTWTGDEEQEFLITSAPCFWNMILLIQ